MRASISTAALVLMLVGCETYEFAPRLVGVGTDECPECEELVLSETRLPQGGVTMSGRFAFEDGEGALSAVRVFVTSPSGDHEDDGTAIPCSFASVESDSVPPRTCEITAERFARGNSGSVAARLKGYSAGVLTATFSADLLEYGEWTIEVEAERASGVLSNRLSATVEVAADVDVGDTD